MSVWRGRAGLVAGATCRVCRPRRALCWRGVGCCGGVVVMTKEGRVCGPPVCVVSGGVLLSRDPAVAVPSALKGLTSGFGMGPGVSRFAVDRRNFMGIVFRAWWCWPCPGNRTVDALHAGVMRSMCVCQAARPISTGQLHTLPCFHLRPIKTQSSSWGPYQVNPEGVLILRRASRLDAFSGYPFRT